MEKNKLYFIKEEYFEKFKCSLFSQNTKLENDEEHRRPCYYSFKNGEIYWMIPISSNLEKYIKVYENILKKYKTCDTICFLYVKGNKNVALIQNMIPVTEKYIDKIYTYARTNIPIEINEKKCKEINAKARKVLRFARKGTALTFTPILELERQLLDEMSLIHE